MKTCVNILANGDRVLGRATVELLALAVGLFCLSAIAQQDVRERPPSIAPIQSELITVDAGVGQTIPGPSAIAVLEAIIGVTGGSTNGVVTSWTYTEGPFFAEFAKQEGLTNLGTFTAIGRYEIEVRAQKGAFFNTNRLFIFVNNQGITNFPPTITIASPANGSEFTAPFNMTLSADAQDKDGTVTQVVFYDGTTILGTSTVAPYTLTLTNLAAGNYVFAAAVTDNHGATNLSTSVSTVVRPPLTPTPIPPSVSLTIPTNGVALTAPVTFNLTATVVDLDGTVASVTFTDNDALLGVVTISPYVLSYSPTVGSHTIKAVALDDTGLTSEVVLSFTVLPTPVNVSPTATLTGPANGSVFTAPAVVAISATASDSDGTVAMLRFFQNGLLIGSDASSPYGLSITNGVGTYQIYAEAVDNQSAVGVSATSTITVNAPPGTPPSVTLTSPTDGQIVTSGAVVTLSATATDDGSITNVSFYRRPQEELPDPVDNIVNDDGSAVVYTGSWTDNNSAANQHNNDKHYSQSTGASATFTFTGSQVAWYGRKFSDNGNADVFLDNVLQATVDEYSATVQHQQELYNSGDITNGTHTLRITCKGTKNPSSAGVFVDVDYFVFQTQSAPGAPVDTKIVEDLTDPYSQPWTPGVGSFLITARATDNLGITTTSSPPATITVNAPIPPSVQLTLPTNGSVFTQGATITLGAVASDQDGTVTSVDFMQFQPDVFIATDVSSPYAGSWVNVPAGNYSLVAKAYDNSGLTTLSSAVNISITPSGPQTVFVDAGPFPTATLSPYKTYFDTEYTAQAGNFNGLANTGTGPAYYNVQFIIDATLSMFEGTKETNYLNRALLWCETMVSKATIIDNQGKKNWGGTWLSPYDSTKIAFQLEEIMGASAMSRAARIVLADPDLRAVWGARATALYVFIRDHIVNKNFITRNGYSSYANWSQNRNSSSSDKPSLMLRITMDLKVMSGILGNSDSATYGWAAKNNEMAEGIKDYNGQEARFLPWQQPGALVWGHGKNWQGYSDIDTSHANRLPFVVVQGYELGQTFTLTHINGLADLLTKVLWDGSTSSPQVRNFMDGSNGTFLNRGPWNNGKTYDGFYMLAGYNTAALNFAKHTALAVKNGVSNPSLSYQGSNYGRTSMAGHLARAVAMRGKPPYAILSGTVTGSGTTGTNWTHVSGPGGYTIVNPTRPVTTILFTPASVGSHTFRLTVTGSGTVSDDVVVTVLAAPAYGSL